MDRDKRERVINDWIQNRYEARKNEDLEPADELIWASEAILEAIWHDPETAWQLILNIIKRDSSEMVLFDVGAGPLENLLNYHAERFIDRIESEARINEAFRTALSGVWHSDIPNSIWARIGAAVGHPIDTTRQKTTKFSIPIESSSTDGDKHERMINDWLRCRYEYMANNNSDLFRELRLGYLDIVDAIFDDPEFVWQVILGIIEKDSSSFILRDLGALPLEDLLNFQTERFIDRVESQARINEAFRTALNSVCQRDMPDMIWKRIRAAADIPIDNKR